MLVSVHTLIGKPVNLLAEQKRIETVKDVVFDPLTRKISAFIVKEKTLITPTRVIPFNSVYHVGQRELIIESRFVIKALSDNTDLLTHVAQGNYFLINREAFSSSGKRIGLISDIFFDSRTGDVDEIEIKEKASLFSKPKESKRFKLSNLRIEAKKVVIDDREVSHPYVQINLKEKHVEKKQSISPDYKVGVRQHTIRPLTSTDAVGMYLTKNILLPNDFFFAQTGELITNKMIHEAEKHGVLDQVLQYATPAAVPLHMRIHLNA